MKDLFEQNENFNEPLTPATDAVGTGQPVEPNTASSRVALKIIVNEQDRQWVTEQAEAANLTNGEYVLSTLKEHVRLKEEFLGSMQSPESSPLMARLTQIEASTAQAIGALQEEVAVLSLLLNAFFAAFDAKTKFDLMHTKDLPADEKPQAAQMAATRYEKLIKAAAVSVNDEGQAKLIEKLAAAMTQAREGE